MFKLFDKTKRKLSYSKIQEIHLEPIPEEQNETMSEEEKLEFIKNPVQLTSRPAPRPAQTRLTMRGEE